MVKNPRIISSVDFNDRLPTVKLRATQQVCGGILLFDETPVQRDAFLSMLPKTSASIAHQDPANSLPWKLAIESQPYNGNCLFIDSDDSVWIMDVNDYTLTHIGTWVGPLQESDAEIQFIKAPESWAKWDKPGIYIVDSTEVDMAVVFVKED